MLNVIRYVGNNENSILEVRLAGKKVGEIRPVEASPDHAEGFAYFPKGHGATLRGEVFATVRLVKDSLEAE